MGARWPLALTVEREDPMPKIDIARTELVGPGEFADEGDLLVGHWICRRPESAGEYHG